MKKLFLFTWMMMLSIVAMAQTIMVIDKDGNRIPYDPEKVSSVDFQVSPPGSSTRCRASRACQTICLSIPRWCMYLWPLLKAMKRCLLPR